MEAVDISLLIPIALIGLYWLLRRIFKRTPKAKVRYQKGLEREFQEAHHEGETEVTVTSGEIKVRIDDLTKKNAIEYDFTKKWAEALGQALRFARLKNRRGGIVFILSCDSDIEYVRESLKDIKYFRLPVDVWTVTNFTDKKVKVKI